MADQADLVDALRALVAGMAAQQRQQQVNNQERSRTAATSSIPAFSEKTGEVLEDWLSLLNRVATAVNWDDNNKMWQSAN